MIGREMKDAYDGQVRTGVVVGDLNTHWQVDWGPNRTKIRKDRVGNKPKRQGPWWPGPAPLLVKVRAFLVASASGVELFTDKALAEFVADAETLLGEVDEELGRDFQQG